MANVLNVKPTKMELQELKEQLEVAKRGHKLLKDKQDELVRQFIDFSRKNAKLRSEVEEVLTEALKSFALASAMINEKFLEEVVAIPTKQVNLHIVTKNIMSVKVPQMTFDYKEENEEQNSDFAYSYLNTPSDLDGALEQLQNIMDKLLELSELEKTTQLMADEIEKTRRRVNALEYRMIPDTEETIAYIKAQIAETERSTKIRMMKVKDFGTQF